MYKLIKPLIRKEIKWIFLVFLVQVFSIIMSMIQPLLNGKFIDVLIYAKKYEELVKYIILVLGISALNLILAYYYKLFLIKLKNRMFFKLNMNIMDHLRKIPIELYENFNPTYLNQRVKGDCELIISYWLENTVAVFLNGFGILAILGILFDTNKSLFVASLFLLPVYCVLYIVLKTPLYKKKYQATEAENVYFDYLNDTYIRNREIKVKASFDNEKIEIENKYNNYFTKLLAYSRKLLGFSSMDNIVAVMFQIILFIVGGKQVIQGEMTVGEFSVMNTYFNMILNFAKYYFGLGQRFQTVKVAKERLEDLLDIPREEVGNEIISHINSIQISNVNYKFGSKNIYSASINYAQSRPGIYCIIGRNGAGKTTLINILLGVNNYGLEGDVYINKINLRNIDTNLLRKYCISTMLQGEKLPSISVERYIDQNIKNSQSEAENSLTVESFINIFQNDLFDFKNIMKKNMQELSSGERQMVLLLTTLGKKADLYILDEPTSNLFSELIEEIVKILMNLKAQGKIVIIISHDNSIIRYCDSVYQI